MQDVALNQMDRFSSSNEPSFSLTAFSGYMLQYTEKDLHL